MKVLWFNMIYEAKALLVSSEKNIGIYNKHKIIK